MTSVSNELFYPGTQLALDTLKLAQKTAKIVTSGEKRKYYRFRPASYYGRVATADCVGCCLTCLFCWSWHILVQPEKRGRLYSLEEVARDLTSIAGEKGFDQVRTSGNEPALHRSHLLRVLELIPKKIHFILETNGILIGHDPSYAKDISPFPNLHVRVSIKGACSEDFSKLTEADAGGFNLQVKALENLVEEGDDCFPAVMTNFSSQGEIKRLRERLKEVRPDFYDFERDDLTLYSFVEENLKGSGLSYHL